MRVVAARIHVRQTSHTAEASPREAGATEAAADPMARGALTCASRDEAAGSAHLLAPRAARRHDP